MSDELEPIGSQEPMDTKDITLPQSHFWTEVTERSRKREIKYIISDPVPKTPKNEILLKTLLGNLRNAQQQYNYDNMSGREAYESYEVDGQSKGKFTLTEIDDGLRVVATLNKETFSAITDINILEIALETRSITPTIYRE